MAAVKSQNRRSSGGELQGARGEHRVLAAALTEFAEPAAVLPIVFVSIVYSMYEYEHANGFVLFRSAAGELEFAVLSRSGDAPQMRYVYVPKFRIPDDPSLEWVRDEGTELTAGWVVELPRWNVRVDSRGDPRTS